MEESKEFKKYWDLLNNNKLSNKHADYLIKLYKKYRNARNKCTAAILLSHIDNNDRIPPILFDVLKYWDASGYGGWVLTSNSRLFNYYTKFRKKYLDLMFNGNKTQRSVLANSLCLFQEPLNGFSYRDRDRILKNFIKKEKDDILRRFIINNMNIQDNIDFVEQLLTKLDPLNLMKGNLKENPYKMTAVNISGVYKDKKQAIKRIKYIFDLELKKIPEDKMIERIASNILKKI